MNEMIIEELVELDMDVKSQDEFFERIAAKLHKLGYVKDSYENALKTREANYPTALPVEPYPVAIPHAEIEHIIKPFIAPIRFKHPISWNELSNNEVEHQVKFVFVLGFLKSDAHVDLLQILIENFQIKEFMDQLVNAQTPEEYYKLVCGMKGM